MKDLITFKNAQIDALHNEVNDLSTKIAQLESFIFELTEKDIPEEYKSVVRHEVFEISY
jgi:hypothetical protein